TLDADTMVTATFLLQDFALAVTTAGPGSVSSNPAGISCDPTCRAAFAPGTTVTLTATAAAGATFSGWGGTCAGTTALCPVMMTALTQAYQAALLAPPTYTDPAIAAGQVPVRAAHIAELRAAVLALQ